MELDSIYSILLIVSLTMLIAQLAVRDKKTIHLAFAVFCGSMAMVAAKQLGSESMGAYQYLIGLGTCATCNGFWLVSRALFREESAISLRHILVAVTIALLIMINQGIKLANGLSPTTFSGMESFVGSLGEITNLLSSSILCLTFWEAARGYTNSTGPKRWQRILFMLSFGSAVFATTVVTTAFIDETQMASVFPWFVVFSALQIMLVTQGIILWQHSHARASSADSEKLIDVDSEVNVEPGESSQFLVSGIENALYQNQLFLQPNLKMLDLARQLDVPEYRVSRALRYHFKARNFNQFINSLRIEHAKTLLESPSNQHWTILVVGLESGFASIGPFNRAFKSECGCTPNEYRQNVFPNAMMSQKRQVG